MSRFERKHLVVPVILVLGWLAQPGGYLERQRLFDLQRHPGGTASSPEASIASVASGIARRDVEARCVDLSDAHAAEPLGRVRWVVGMPVDYMEVRPDVCTTLSRFRREPLRPCVVGDRPCLGDVDRVAQAVTAVAHEAFHLRGVRDEATTQCYAVQHVLAAARGFGADARAAGMLAQWAWRIDYPLLPPAYRAADCTPGGPLDLRTGSPWT